MTHTPTHPIKYLQAASTPPTFLGFPAYLDQRIFDDGQGKVSSKTLGYADVRNFYRLSLTLRGKSISSRAQAAADRAWQTMMHGFKPA